MHEGKLCKGEIVGKLSIEIVLRKTYTLLLGILKNSLLKTMMTDS